MKYEKSNVLLCLKVVFVSRKGAKAQNTAKKRLFCLMQRIIYYHRDTEITEREFYIKKFSLL